MKKILCLVFCCFFSFSMFALDGKVISTTGKVEILKNDSWVTLKKGDKVPQGATISTGFKSNCEISAGGSVITVAQLSRVTLSELVEEKDVVKTELYLDAGSIKNNVKPLHNKANDYKVKTAAVTSSVRGTIFEVRSNGNVTVYEGKVEVEDNKFGTKTMVKAGEEFIFKENELPELDIADGEPMDGSGGAAWQQSQYGANTNINFQ